MRGKTAEQIRELLAYEQATTGRPSVVRMYENRLAKLGSRPESSRLVGRSPVGCPAWREDLTGAAAADPHACCRWSARWIGKLGTVWVEGQITELTARGGTVFLTLRDPVANVSRPGHLPARRLRGDRAAGRPTGARVVMHVKPDFCVNRGSFAFTALEIRPVGVGELLARLERLRQVLAAEGLFNADRKRRLPFLPGTIGLICGRDSAAERDVLENARRRWPAVRFKVEAGRRPGAVRRGRGHRGAAASSTRTATSR